MATSTLTQNNSTDVSSLVSLSRTERAYIAADTLNTLKAGWYQLHDGSRVDLEDDIIFCNKHSVLYTEDDLHITKRSIRTIDEVDSTTSPTSTDSQTKIEVRHCTTLQAAQALATEMGGDRVGVLNFASAKNPGGGFLKGSQAQEESIARSSSLYLALTQPRFLNEFYDYNRRGKRGIYSHRMIYSPRVTMFKDDNGELLSSPYHVGIVTVPAPNAGVMKDATAAQHAMIERVKRLLYVFQANKHDTLVLGAFGCGVFQNNPLDVAIIFREHLESKDYRHAFKRIIFAILDPKMYQMFEHVFSETDFTSLQHRISTISLDDGGNKQDLRNNRNRQPTKKSKQTRTRNNYFEQIHDETNHNYDDDDDD